MLAFKSNIYVRKNRARDMAQPTKCCLCKHEASNLEYNKIGLGSIPIILALRGELQQVLCAKAHLLLSYVSSLHTGSCVTFYALTFL